MRIRIVTGCRAGGRGFAAGEVVTVPDGLSAQDAALLLRIGRAEALPDEPAVEPERSVVRKAKRK